MLRAYEKPSLRLKAPHGALYRKQINGSSHVGVKFHGSAVVRTTPRRRTRRIRASLLPSTCARIEESAQCAASEEVPRSSASIFLSRHFFNRRACTGSPRRGDAVTANFAFEFRLWGLFLSCVDAPVDDFVFLASARAVAELHRVGGSSKKHVVNSMLKC